MKKSFSSSNLYRLLWLFLVILTILIMVFPIKLTLVSSPVQSISIFGDRFSLFATLFYMWFIVLSVLFLKQKEEWKLVILLSIFALVYLGFWVFITPYHQGIDALSFATHTRSVSEKGLIDLTEKNLQYFDFPGLFLFATAIMQITSLNIFETENIISFLAAVLCVLFLYGFYKSYLRNTCSLIPFIIVLSLMGNRGLSYPVFHPGYVSTALVFIFLWLLCRDELGHKSIRNKLLIVILIVAATATYFMASCALPLILFGTNLLRRRGIESWNLMLLALTIVLAWQAFWAVRTFGTIIGLIPYIKQEILSWEKFTYFHSVGMATMGPTQPFWARITQAFWLVFVYGFGSLLAFKNLLQVRKLGDDAKLEIGGFLGVLILSLLAGFVSPRGFRFGQPILAYGSIFLAAILVRFLLKHSRKIFASVLILCVALSFPTFLIYHSSISANALYPQDISTAEFLKSNYPLKEKESIVFTNQRNVWDMGFFYFPNTKFKGMAEFGTVKYEAEFWQNLNDLIQEFKQLSPNDRIFVFSERAKARWTIMLGIMSGHPNWEQTEKGLAKMANRIYCNPHYQVYLP